MVVGSNRLNSGGTTYSVDLIIVHEEYDNYLIKNDVSLIRVASDIQFNDRVQPIALPANDTEAGAPLLLSGWGTTTVSKYYSLEHACTVK